MYKMQTTKTIKILQSLSLILSEDDFDFFFYKASEPTLVAFVAIVQILNQKSRYCGKQSKMA